MSILININLLRWLFLQHDYSELLNLLQILIWICYEFTYSYTYHLSILWDGTAVCMHMSDSVPQPLESFTLLDTWIYIYVDGWRTYLRWTCDYMLLRVSIILVLVRGFNQRWERIKFMGTYVLVHLGCFKAIEHISTFD